MKLLLNGKYLMIYDWMLLMKQLLKLNYLRTFQNKLICHVKTLNNKKFTKSCLSLAVVENFLRSSHKICKACPTSM